MDINSTNTNTGKHLTVWEEVELPPLDKSQPPIEDTTITIKGFNKSHWIYAIIALVLVSIGTYAMNGETEAERAGRIAKLDYLRTEQVKTIDLEVNRLEACKAQVESELKTDVEIVDCYGRTLSTSTGAVVESKDSQTTSTWTSTGGIAPVPERWVITTGRFLRPEELLWPVKTSDDCYITQTESNHVRPERGGMFATDIACKFWAQGWVGGKAEVYAPDLRGKAVKYKVLFVGKDELLGSFIQLQSLKENSLNEIYDVSDESFYLWHTESKLKAWDIVTTGQRIGQMTMDGATTGWHVHFEYRRLSPGGAWASQRYFTGLKEQVIDNKRKNVTYNGWKWGDKIYASAYDLGDVNQNDASPNIWASGKDLRHVPNAVALTKDVRRSLWLKFWDKILIQSEDWKSHAVQVEDEMNMRYRETWPENCVKPTNGTPHCIKMDMARPVNKLTPWVYTLISKVN